MKFNDYYLQIKEELRFGHGYSSLEIIRKQNLKLLKAILKKCRKCWFTHYIDSDNNKRPYGSELYRDYPVLFEYVDQIVQPHWQYNQTMTLFDVSMGTYSLLFDINSIKTKKDNELFFSHYLENNRKSILKNHMYSAYHNNWLVYQEIMDSDMEMFQLRLKSIINDANVDRKNIKRIFFETDDFNREKYPRLADELIIINPIWVDIRSDDIGKKLLDNTDFRSIVSIACRQRGLKNNIVGNQNQKLIKHFFTVELKDVAIKNNTGSFTPDYLPLLKTANGVDEYYPLAIEVRSNELSSCKDCIIDALKHENNKLSNWNNFCKSYRIDPENTLKCAALIAGPVNPLSFTPREIIYELLKNININDYNIESLFIYIHKPMMDSNHSRFEKYCFIKSNKKFPHHIVEEDVTIIIQP